MNSGQQRSVFFCLFHHEYAARQFSHPKQASNFPKNTAAEREAISGRQCPYVRLRPSGISQKGINAEDVIA